MIASRAKTLEQHPPKMSRTMLRGPRVGIGEADGFECYVGFIGRVFISLFRHYRELSCCISSMTA